MTTEIASAEPPPAEPAESDFRAVLGHFHLRWRTGLLIAGIFRAIGLLALTLVALGVLDYYAGFSDPARHVAAGVLVLSGVAWVIVAIWKMLAFSRRHAAGEADRILSNGRKEILSALEFSKAPGAATPLTLWLRERTAIRAAAMVSGLELRRWFPLRLLSKRFRRALAAAALAGLCILVAPEASTIIGRRILDPNADIPPYSPLRFAVGPRPAEVLYGGELVVSAEITGGNVDAPVRCLTRDRETGRIEDSLAFRESGGRFSQKLEKVDAPVEVAFAVGRARSRWMPVAVRLQPRVQEIVLTVEPPAYSGLPRREFAAGSQELAALAGSRITARLTSNRPLHEGILRIHGQSSGAPEPDREVAAELEEPHRVRFTWEVGGPAHLALEVRDVLGTASEPVQLEQKVIPDERPDVVLREPGGEVLATPDGELPIEGAASDDLGLSRVVLVRKLQGYRERPRTEPIQPGTRRYDLNGKLNLAPLGLVPGQTVELTVEATDTNPTLLGVGVSESAHIHIIAREEYARMLRDRATLEDFAGRYSALREALEGARKSLDELGKAVESGDAKQAEAARQKALDAHENAGKVFGQIARDFPIFDLDQALGKASQDVAASLFENAKQLQELWRAQPDELRGALPQLKERLGESEKQMGSALDTGERAIAAGKVFEQAGRFNELLTGQRSLVQDYNRMLEQIRRGEMQAGQALRDLGRRQDGIAEGLRQFEKDLGDALGALPEEFSGMKEDGQKFLDAFRELEIPPVMDEGTKAAGSGDGKTAGDRAGEAFARLEALLRRQNGFCSMCRGDGEKFPWPQDIARTLEELMQSLIPKPGTGSGSKPGQTGGGGAGFGGRNDSGYVMKGKMPELPVYGPPRSRFSRNAGPDVGDGGAGGKGAGRPEAGAEVRTSRVGTGAGNGRAGEALATQAVPEAYREAVKRFFSTAGELGSAESEPSNDPSKP